MQIRSCTQKIEGERPYCGIVSDVLRWESSVLSRLQEKCQNVKYIVWYFEK